VRMRFLPRLSTSKGKLRSGVAGGLEVHAATFPRRRDMVLDSALLTHPKELARVLTHEVFHFVWVRLANAKRRSYEELVRLEMAARARGELGWPSQVVKNSLTAEDVAGRSRRWREYACESFCDSAAWLYSGIRSHEEWSLAQRFRSRRRKWFEALIDGGPLVL